MIMTKGLGILERIEIAATNLTGAPLVIGGVYALDITRINAASVDSDTSLTNVVVTAAANLRCILLVALQATGVGATARMLYKGFGPVLVDGTTPVVPGDRLIPQAGSPNLIKQPNPSLVNPIGFAMAAQATAAGTLTPMYFDGGVAWKGERAVS